MSFCHLGMSVKFTPTKLNFSETLNPKALLSLQALLLPLLIPALKKKEASLAAALQALWPYPGESFEHICGISYYDIYICVSIMCVSMYIYIYCPWIFYWFFTTCIKLGLLQDWGLVPPWIVAVLPMNNLTSNGGKTIPSTQQWS